MNELVEDSMVVVIDAVVKGPVLVVILVVDKPFSELEIVEGRLADKDCEEVLSDDDDMVVEKVGGGVSVVDET